MHLDQIDYLPSEMCDTPLNDITRVFPNPTLISVSGEREDPLFVSTLLHGNETTSYSVLQEIARRYATTRPPRSLMIFVGNVRAAAQGKRFLPGQPDFNRFWSRTSDPGYELAEHIMDIAQNRYVFASIDIHNNTGANPLYGCVSTYRPADLYLAARFAPVGVFYLNPPTTQSIAFSRICPSITIECGQNDTQEGIERAIDLVEHVMSLDAFPRHTPAPDALRLYETIGRVLINSDTQFSFGEGGFDLVLRADLEEFNFKNMKQGTHWATCVQRDHPFRVVDEHGTDLTDQFFHFDGARVLLTQDITPSMITHDTAVIRQDCLCYLMKPHEPTPA